MHGAPLFVKAHMQHQNSIPRFIRNSARGFTAVELMVVVAIVAILAAVAAPNFSGMIGRWRVRQSVEALQAAIYFARSEAIKRGGAVVLQKLPNTDGVCSLASATNQWGCGWLVCVDTNSDNACGNNDPVLRQFAIASKTEVQRSAASGAIIFDRWGMPNASFGFSAFTEGTSSSDASNRGLCMSSGGRLRSTDSASCS